MLKSDQLIKKTPLYPLRFEPIYKNYIWGGIRLRTLFQRQLPESLETAAESWEIADLPDNSSIVSNGVLRGYLLHDLMEFRLVDLMGTEWTESMINTNQNVTPKLRFPMLLKYLDAASTLSIQIHPTDKLAAEMRLEYSGKSETWVIIDAEPNSVVWAGTEDNYSQEQLQQLIIKGGIETAMKPIKVKVGDCFYIPPGTLHSLGAGVLAAELQQPSNATFRVFDWNRHDWNGVPRQLHKIEAAQALLTQKTNNPVTPQKTNMPICELLVNDPNFLLYRWTFDQPVTLELDDSCSIWTVFNGNVKIGQETLKQGDSILIPAAQKIITWFPINNPNIKNNTIVLGQGKTVIHK
ncbi:MAG: class I mannose-6-phosphate isomerase [Planctomycetaceae bacterium]|jgi:mannose-6-phosphate isomerase|nr:class I mannose-6-phosphate isomerase [Planctomycetaceae bacterium]